MTQTNICDFYPNTIMVKDYMYICIYIPIDVYSTFWK